MQRKKKDNRQGLTKDPDYGVITRLYVEYVQRYKTNSENMKVEK